MVYQLPSEISEAGHRILLVIKSKEIMSKGSDGLTFNQLRRPPYRFNPRTLARQLKPLHSQGLISYRAHTGRGGKRYPYTLTPKGKRFLHHPISLGELDRVLLYALARILGSDSKIENQLLGIGLATKKSIKYQVELSVRLNLKDRAREITLKWDKYRRRPIHPYDVKISDEPLERGVAMLPSDAEA
jgi:DNA-binding PadR family transcriptional regulator